MNRTQVTVTLVMLVAAALSAGVFIAFGPFILSILPQALSVFLVIGIIGLVLLFRAACSQDLNNPNYGYGVRGFPKDQGFDSIGLRQLSLKPDPGGSPQWRWISQRSTAVLMTSAKCSRTGKRTS